MTDERNSVGLAEAVRQLRAELTEAMDEGEGKRVQFELGPVEMEFLVDVRREGGAEAGVRVAVMSLGGKASFVKGSSHRLKLVLNPQDRPGEPARISGEE